MDIYTEIRLSKTHVDWNSVDSPKRPAEQKAFFSGI